MPDGWPRVATFMDSCESFSIYRQFGSVHARLLLIHMSNIQEMVTELRKIDRSDEAGGEDTNWRLKNRIHKKGLDSTKKRLQRRLEKELLAYGKIFLITLTGEIS